MKKLYTLIAAVLLTATVWAQSPNKMSYQAVMRNADNELVTNGNIGMQISILQGSADGSSVYTETQSAISNENGLVTIEIGTGNTTDDFSAIDWANGPYFIKTETDPSADGGTNYTITGTSQLMSVPYALYAANSAPQTISQTGNEVTLSDGGGSVTITDTDTQLDAAGITALGFTSGAHTVDTDTQLDAAGVTALGFTSGAHTVDTDTQLDAAGVTALGFTSGAHTVDTDTQLDAAGITALGFTSGAHTVDTDTQLDAAGITALGFTSGAHTVDTNTQLDEAGVTALGFTSGAHTTNTDTQQLNVSLTGDTLSIDGGNYVIIPGISAAQPIKIGDYRFGGIVFFIDGTGQSGLVCNVEDNSVSSGGGFFWGCKGTLISGADATTMGSGPQNTVDITLGCSEPTAAANYITAQNINGYNDWFLPSKDELYELLLNRNKIESTSIAYGGTVIDGALLSSSEFDSEEVWYSYEVNGSVYSSKIPKYNNVGSRSVREF